MIDQLPDVALLDPEGVTFRLRDLGQPIVVYFYPKDDTSGCTTEAIDFSSRSDAFADAGVLVLGVSRDTPESHAKFARKHDLSVRLASDPEGEACVAFDVWKEKNMYGRTFMGIERSTFLFDGRGALVREWRKVRVKGHAEQVLDAARALSEPAPNR